MWHLAEEEAIFCGADCGRAEAGAVESACGGGDSQGGISMLGMEMDQARQMKQLQEENSRLKRMVADLSLE